VLRKYLMNFMEKLSLRAAGRLARIPIPSLIGSVIEQVAHGLHGHPRKVWLTVVIRSGSPNDTLLAPRLMLTPNSLRIQFDGFAVWTSAALLVRADRHHQRIRMINRPSAGMPILAACYQDFFRHGHAVLRRSWECLPSRSVRPMTAAPALFCQRQYFSSRFSSPLMELISACRARPSVRLPAHPDSPNQCKTGHR